MPASFRLMNGASRRLYLNHSAILGGLVIFAALSCDLNNSLDQDAGTSKDAAAGQDTGHTCLPLGGACQMCPNGYLADANGCATCQCKPPTTCTTDQCPSPRPAGPNALCPDGKTVSGPACLRAADGTCGWTQVTCPPAPGPCPCAAAELCVTQIGGPAIPDPAPSHCETPDPVCLQRIKMSGGGVVSPCVCLDATPGTCGQGDVIGACTCDNGIR